MLTLDIYIVFCLQEKQRGRTVPGSAALPPAVSFEDLRRHRDYQLSSKRSVDSFGNMRRAKSDTDVALQSLKKKVEVSEVHCVQHDTLISLCLSLSLSPPFLSFSHLQ